MKIIWKKKKNISAKSSKVNWKNETWMKEETTKISSVKIKQKKIYISLQIRDKKKGNNKKILNDTSYWSREMKIK